MISLSEYHCLIVIHFTLLVWTNHNVCNMPLDKSVYSKTHFFLFLIQNISCGHKKETSYIIDSFGHPQQMLILMNKKVLPNSHICLSVDH